MQLTVLHSLAVALIIGIASGAIGAFILLKRMALVGDALSHVALPGIALALFYNVDPFWGVIVFLLGGAVLVWWLEARSQLPVDALVGLLFTASLAIGILTIPEPEALESLFGAFSPLSLGVLMTVLAGGALAIFFTFVLARQFLFTTLSQDLAQVHGVGRGYELVLLIIFAVVVSLGIKLVGTLLMGALTIIPPAITRNITTSMKSYIIISAFLGGGIATAGILLASAFHILPGPAIILLGIGLFILSL